MTPRLTAETILLCACENIGVTIEGMVVVGRRWAVDSTNPSSRALGWRAQASPTRTTRPEQASLASVGGGMAAGAVFAHPRAADARVRPIFLTHM